MPWERAICIPACREWRQLPLSIASLADIAPPKTVLVLVVNGSVDADPDTHEENAKIIAWLKKFPHTKQTHDRWLISYPNLDIVLIDRASVGLRLPSKTGVGLARATGSDWICTLYDQGKITQSWIWNTDADARFPHTYLDVPTQKGTCIVPYIHTGATPDLPMPYSRKSRVRMHLKYN